MKEPKRPEFRDYRMTERELAELLVSIARVYNPIHKDDPDWIPMEEDYDVLH